MMENWEHNKTANNKMIKFAFFDITNLHFMLVSGEDEWMLKFIYAIILEEWQN